MYKQQNNRIARGSSCSRFNGMQNSWWKESIEEEEGFVGAKGVYW